MSSNVFLTIIFGGSIGWLIGFAAKKGNVRNVKLVMMFAILFGVFAEYINWVFWIYAYCKQKSLVLSPIKLLDIIKILNSIGVWSVKGITPTGGILYCVWTIEAGVIIIMSFIASKKFLDKDVFCEDCNRWIETEEKIVYLEPIKISLGEFKDEIQQGRYEHLLELKKVATSATNEYTEIELKACRACSNFFIININHISIIYDSKGKEVKNTLCIITNLIINSSIYEKVRKLKDV